jgi:hypothetical protein
MSDGEQKKRPAVLQPGVLPMIIGIVLGIWAGRLTDDAVQDVVGWWGSRVVGGLTAMVVGLATFFVVQAVVRRRG